MKLNYATASPYARMCVVTAHEAGIRDQLELVMIDAISPIAPHAEVSKANPLGKIPALITEHGHAIYDSRVIIEFLLHHAGNKALLPDEPVQRFRILTLQALGQGIADAALLYRYETFARPEPHRWPEWTARQAARIRSACDDLAAGWMKELKTVNVGSIAAACALGYLDFRMPEIGWRDGRGALADWFAEFSARPSMAATKP